MNNARHRILSRSPKSQGRIGALIVIFAWANCAYALTITSGSGRGLEDARTNAQLAVERSRLDKAEACSNAGMIYGPAFSGPKDANGCLTDVRANVAGGVTINGNSTFNNNLAVTGTSAFTNNVTMGGTLLVTGTVTAAMPTAGTQLATKAYVDTAVAAGGGGGGGGCFTIVPMIGSDGGFGCYSPAACPAGFTEVMVYSGMGGSGYNNYHGYRLSNCDYRVCCKN